MTLAAFLLLLLLTGWSTSSSGQTGLYSSNQTDPVTTPVTDQGLYSSNQTDPVTTPVTDKGLYSSNQTDPVTTPVTAQVTDKEKCSEYYIIRHLGLTEDKIKFAFTRPVSRAERITIVYVQLILYAILDVRESDQSFIPYVWISMEWRNNHIGWELKDYCNITHITVPTELLWKPDITIKEITEKEKTPPSPYLTIEHDGWVKFRSDQVLISTCGMQVYKFPFDTQRCNLSFRSIVYSNEEIAFNNNPNPYKVTAWSQAVIANHSEWRLLSITSRREKILNFNVNQSVLVYTISMQRRPVLYLVSFILPVVFFLSLDFASFLISDTGGEKLSFKITVLLAITVMQLILNEILPSSSDRIPLIAVYCIGIFTMMLLSLLETILVMYLLQKDPADQYNKEDPARSLVMQKWTLCVCDADEPPAQVLPDKEDGSNLTDVSRTLEKVSDDLRKMEKSISLFSNSSKKDGKKFIYWIRVTKRINKVFFVCYVTATVVFLIIIFYLWLKEDGE